jgi:beta-glucosidase
VENIATNHHYTATTLEAAAVALNAGTDLDCSSRAYLNLEEAVAKKLVDEAAVDRALMRLYTTRAKLGMFDDLAQHAYGKIPLAVVDSPEHRALARKAATESIVLLKNNGTLPLDPAIRRIAVIGPNAHDRNLMLGNYYGMPSYTITPYEGLKEALAHAEVHYARGVPAPQGGLEPIPGDHLSQAGGQKGLATSFFANVNLSGPQTVSSVSREVDFDFEAGAPHHLVPSDWFSMRFEGFFTPPEDGTYEIGFAADDRARLWVNGNLLVDNWGGRGFTVKSSRVTFKKGERYPIRLEYADQNGMAQIKLVWRRPHYDTRTAALQLASQSDLNIVVLGTTPSEENEEVDRSTIELAADQEALLKDIYATGKPLVLIVMSGSAVAIPWAKQHADAIIQAWYPGQEGGRALADILMGRSNPSGKLPITLYEKTSDLPALSDYSMQNRTYRYFNGVPLYPFGYGLSYANFSYQLDRISSHTLTPRGSLEIKVRVQNLAERSGPTTVQLYLKPLDSTYETPRLTLRRFQKVELAAKAETFVSWTLSGSDFATVDPDGNSRIEPGRYLLYIGPHSMPELERNFAAEANFIRQEIELLKE